MKINLSSIQEYINDIPSTLVGDPNSSGFQEVRLWNPGISTAPDTAYVGQEQSFTEDGGTQIVCWFQNSYLLFDSQDMSTILNRILDAFHFYTQWMQQCEQLTATGCALADLLAVSEPVLHHPLLIVDASQFMIGMSPSAILHSMSEEWTTAMKDQSIAAETLRRFNIEHEASFHENTFFHLPADFFPAPSCCHHIFLDEERIATLVMIENEVPLSSGQAHLAKQLIPFIAKWIRTCTENDSSVHGISVMAKLLDHAPEADIHMNRRLELFGWNKSCPKRFIAARCVSSSVHYDAYLSKAITSEQEGIYSIPYNRHVLILVNMELIDGEELSRELNYRFFQNYYCGAVSAPFTDIRQIPQAYQHAIHTLDKCALEPGQLYDCSIHALEFLTNALQAAMQLSLLHPLPKQMQEYDKLHNTEYGKTLFMFLRCERNHTLTAKRMFIHRNTLFLRLQNIREIWNPNIEDDENRFLLLYTFYHLHYND